MPIKHNDDINEHPTVTMAKCAWTAIKRAGYGDDTCVLAAKVIKDCLTVLGKRPVTVPVSFVVYSPRYLEMFRQHGGHPHDEEEYREWQSDPLVHIVATDTEHLNDGRFAGHMVTLCDGWFLDPSIVQAHRPERGIWLQPLFIEAPKGFPDPKRRALLKSISHVSEALGTGGTSHIVYEKLEHYADYTSAPDWSQGKSAPLVLDAITMYTTIALNASGRV